MMEKKKLLMEFGLRALMNEMFGPAPPFPREYMENIPAASAMRKKTYRRQPLRRAAVARDLKLSEEIPVPVLRGNAAEKWGLDNPEDYAPHSSIPLGEYFPTAGEGGGFFVNPETNDYTPLEVTNPRGARINRDTHPYTFYPEPKRIPVPAPRNTYPAIQMPIVFPDVRGKNVPPHVKMKRNGV